MTIKFSVADNGLVLENSETFQVLMRALFYNVIILLNYFVLQGKYIVKLHPYFVLLSFS